MKLSIKKVSSLLLIASLLFTACEGPSSVSSPSQESSMQQPSSPAAQPGVPQQSSPPVQPVSGNLSLAEELYHPSLVAGHYVFWQKAYDSATTTSKLAGSPTYGYDLQTRQSFVVKQAADSAVFLLSDGVDLLWRVLPPAERDSGAAYRAPVQSIALNNISDANAPTKLITGFTQNDSTLEAYDQGILYYRKGELGIYSYNLNTGAENMVTAHADGLVVHEGVLLWQDSLGHGYHSSPTRRLHLQTSELKDIIIAQDDFYDFNSYRADGNNVVWSSDLGTYLYDISKQTTTRLTAAPSEDAVIAGDNIAWVAVTPVDGGLSQRAVWSYELKSGQSRVVVASSTAHLYVDGLTAQGDLVYGVENRKTGQRGLYLTSVSSSNAGYDTVYDTSVDANPAVLNTPIPEACRVTHYPTNCGQVAASGRNFTDDVGVWRGKGVHVFLPDYELGGESFYVRNYFNPKTAALQAPLGLVRPDVETLLNAAQHGVKANFVRIFVDLPGDSLKVPEKVASIDAILDFLIAANRHKLRVGIVMHNSSKAKPDIAYFRDNYFKMDLTGTPLVLPSCAGQLTTPTPTPTPINQIRKQWIQAFITCVTNRNLSDVVAYVSADNEINNHCNQPGIAYNGTTPVEGRVDCFAASKFPGYDALAQRWVREFNALFVGTGIMTTVGLSTEMYTEGIDRQPAIPENVDDAVGRFFEASTGEQPLYDSVTFLSPHNYGGAGPNIIVAIRAAEAPLVPLKPVMLEEYGHATDPFVEGVKSSNIVTPAASPTPVTSPTPSVIHPNNTEGASGCVLLYQVGYPANPFYPRCANVAPWYIGVNAKSIRENGYAGGAAFMLTDVYPTGAGPVADESCKKPDYYTGLYSIGLVSDQGKKISYCCGTYTTYPAGARGLSDMSKLKLTGTVVLYHHQQPWLEELYE